MSAICCFLSQGAVADSEYFDAMAFDYDEGVPVLVTPTRLKQSRHDIPASITRISADDIKGLQLRTIPEALRYVAGMIVGYASGNQPRINYHGTNGLIPRRMQVLLDGMSVYRAGYADVVWPALPITIQDVWAIEVTRAASSPTYGQNSMQAVVNILTKNPAQAEPEVAYRQGSQGTEDIYFQVGGSPTENFSYRLSVAKERDTGFDTNFRQEERHDSTDIDHMYARGQLKLSEETDINLFMGLSQGTTELEYRENTQVTFPDIYQEDQFYQGELSHTFNENHEFKAKIYHSNMKQEMSWVSCQPRVLFLPSLRELNLQNPEYAAAIAGGGMPSGGTAEDDALAQQVIQDIGALGSAASENLCVIANEGGRETRFDIEVEDTYIVSEKLRFVTGANIARHTLDVETYLNKKAYVMQYRMFGNAEYRFNKFVLNFGAMIEDEERYLDRPEISPRLGLNYRLNKNNTVRYALSRSIRTPDILEMERDWSYATKGLIPDENGEVEYYHYHNAKATGDLKPEEIVSHEIGFYGHYNFLRKKEGISEFQYDVKIFHDELDDLISEKLQFFDYFPTNDTQVTLKGIEFEMTYMVQGGFLPDYITKIKAHVNYAYVDSDASNFFERSLHARDSGAFYSLLYFPNDYHLSLSYYGNSAINGEAFDGYEFGLGKSFKMPEGAFEVDAKAIYWPDKVSEFTVSETFNVQNNSNESTNFYVTARYIF